MGADIGNQCRWVSVHSLKSSVRCSEGFNSPTPRLHFGSPLPATCTLCSWPLPRNLGGRDVLSVQALETLPFSVNSFLLFLSHL